MPCIPAEPIVSLKTIFTLFAANLVIAAAATAAPIVRHTNPPPAIILDGVTIPSGAETVLLSGQLTNPIVEGRAATIEDYGNTKTQTISTLNKIKAARAKLCYSMSDIVKLTVFVAVDPNPGYEEFFGTVENPKLVARSTVQVAALAGPISGSRLKRSRPRHPRASRVPRPEDRFGHPAAHITLLI
jgi:enamine deaminase RidA (YjgF/YER057c/UK114 family)